MRWPCDALAGCDAVAFVPDLRSQLKPSFHRREKTPTAAMMRLTFRQLRAVTIAPASIQNMKAIQTIAVLLAALSLGVAAENKKAAKKPDAHALPDGARELKIGDAAPDFALPGI